MPEIIPRGGSPAEGEEAWLELPDVDVAAAVVEEAWLDTPVVIVGEPADADIPVAGVRFWLDDAGSALKIKAKLASGTIVTATVALV